MGVDLRLFLPDWMFESERFSQFIECIQDFTDEVIGDIDEIKVLQVLSDLIEEKEWVNEFLRQIGAGFGFVDNEIDRIKMDVVDMIRRVGIYEAFAYLVRQVYEGKIGFEDNFTKVLRLSENGILSGAFLQDGYYYRDGSINILAPFYLMTERRIRIIDQFFPVGVFVYFIAMFQMYLLNKILLYAQIQMQKWIRVTINEDAIILS